VSGPPTAAMMAAASWPISESTSLVTLPSGPGPPPITARWALRMLSTAMASVCAM
jgi:hypothetical protein